MKEPRKTGAAEEQLNADIPTTLGDRIRSYKAAKRGRTVKAIVVAALTAYLDEQERRDKKKRGA